MIPDYILRMRDAKQREECRDLWRRVYSEMTGGIAVGIGMTGGELDHDMIERWGCDVADRAVKHYLKRYYDKHIMMKRENE